MIYNILDNENIMNATANVTATAQGVAMTGAETDMFIIGAGGLLVMLIAMGMD